jgi:O-antigen/teichoic acid export membrane protein
MKNYWYSAGFYALLNQLTQLVFNLGTVMILFRVLDKETFGVWVIFLTVTAFIEIGRSGLLQNSLMTFLNTTPQLEHAKINTASLFLNIVLSSVFVLLLLFGGAAIGNFYGKTGLTQLLNIYAATTIVLAGLYQFNFIQQAFMDFKGLFWSGFVKNGLFFLYVLYLKITNSPIELPQLAWCQFIAAIPSLVMAYILVKKHLYLSKNLDWDWVKKLFHYGKYTFGTNLATVAHKNVDKGLLGKMLLDKLSTYDLATKVNQLTEVPTTTLAGILFPQTAKRSATEGVSSSKYLYEKGVGVLLALILPLIIFVLLFADIIVQIIGSEKYAGSANVLRITVFYGIFMAFAVQFGTILDSMGKPKLNFFITAVGAVVNLICNYIFITVFGLIGAAYGTLVALSIMFLVMQTLLFLMLEVRFFNVFKYMILFYDEIWGKLKKALF